LGNVWVTKRPALGCSYMVGNVATAGCFVICEINRTPEFDLKAPGAAPPKK